MTDDASDPARSESRAKKLFRALESLPLMHETPFLAMQARSIAVVDGYLPSTTFHVKHLRHTLRDLCRIMPS
jgi:hypothetical protein